VASKQSGGIPTPAVYGKGMGLRVLDYNELELTAAADSAGVALLQTDVLSSDQLLRIERIVVYGTSANLCQITVYNGDDSDSPLPQRARDGTPFPSGLLAVAEYPNYLTITSGNALTVAVTGASDGDQFFAAAQYQLCQRVLGQAYWPSS
jgi:hypothetical protein